MSDGRAGSAVFSLDTDPPPGGWVGRRLPNSSSSTYCELYGVLDAVSLLCQRGISGAVICDSQSALQALSSSHPAYRSVVHRILCFLALMCERGLTAQFIWIPSHIGIRCSNMVDSLAKAACALPAAALPPSPSLACCLKRVRVAAFMDTSHRRDQQRPASISIQHYDAFRHHRYKYRRRGLLVRRHNVVSARLRLGYRLLWQVTGEDDVPQFSSCPLCYIPNGNTLQHCLSCPEVSALLPQGQPLLDVCRYLLIHDNLDHVLARHPLFGSC